ncbi:DegT/DnrJ/EryC1/StrS family aminotransferase [Mycolicibacterium fortuitum]|uniref:DegT/DnrJ/EryC1/StrS family aminotransferase n=1 Tax=Mycolicibacterium fortuitum TaxID=1766 RepID=UPI0026175783|nr:DegT/DnrJ/EryC1/StrS family aminotransferase [Mycolicibacterium fortuitum]
MPGPGYSQIGQDEKKNAEDVLSTWALTRYLVDDPENQSWVRRFEKTISSKLDSPHAVAVNSGTSALVTALAGLGIGTGDEVIVPGYTYVASIGAIAHIGATPVLAEIDDTLTLAPTDVAARITSRTKAIMAVHMLGAPCDLDALRTIADDNDLALIEDAAQAFGGGYKGRALGSIGDAGAFSFNPYKVITTGEGGVALFARYRDYYAGYAFQDQGWPPGREFGYEPAGYTPTFGLNLRMPELSAAIGCAQLNKLDDVLHQVRRARDHLLAVLRLPVSAHLRPSNDRDGDTGNVVVVTFDDRAHAQRAAAKLGTTTLDDSGRHFYANMIQLGERARRGTLPRTDDLLARSIALSVGVSDGHLGSGYGIHPDSTNDEIATVARQFCETVAATEAVEASI